MWIVGTLSHLMVTCISKAKCFRTCIKFFRLIFLRQTHTLESLCADLFLSCTRICICILII